jgi:hypothetical protein
LFLNFSFANDEFMSKLIALATLYIYRVFGCVVASAFEATTATHPFDNAPTTDFYWWGLPLIVTRPQVCKKQQFAAS